MPHAGLRHAPDRVETLFSAMIAIGEGLDLDNTLHQIVESARSLVDARYGAFGVLDEDRSGLAQFVVAGMDQDQREQMGELPRGGGLLGELIARPEPLRLDNLTDHPSSVGVPAGHPPMHSFLGVPVRVRGQVYGNLYLTEKRHGRFSPDDEAVVTALAAAAALAIDNARLYSASRALVHEAEQRERRLEASAEVTNALLGGTDPDEALALVAERATELTDGHAAIITTPAERSGPEDEPATVRVTMSVGLEEDLPVGTGIAVRGSMLSAVLHSRAPRVEQALTLDVAGEPVGLGPSLVVPVRDGRNVSGILVVARRPGSPPFRPEQLSVVASFADQAALVVRLAESQRARRQLDLFADRERIAADLHDNVLQRLFAVGLGLQATLPRIAVPHAIARVNHAVDQLDSIVRDIRTTIFDLHTVDGRPGLGGRLRGVVAELSTHVALEPVVRMSGPIDAVAAGLVPQVEAVVREGVSNALRHGAPSSVTVTVSVDEVLTVDVVDDGVGIPAAVARSGLANLAARARAVGGDMLVGCRGGEGGTRLCWWVPLDATESSDQDGNDSLDRSSP